MGILGGYKHAVRRHCSYGDRRLLSAIAGTPLPLPVLFRPGKYLVNCLSPIKPPGDFYIVRRFTAQQSKEPKGSSRAKGLVQGVYPVNPDLCVVCPFCLLHVFTLI